MVDSKSVDLPTPYKNIREYLQRRFIRVTLIPCYAEVDCMVNLTISVDEEVLKQARIRAVEQGTSVNAVLREYLEAYAGVRQRQEEAIGDLLRLSHSAKSRRGGSKWIRDELHER